MSTPDFNNLPTQLGDYTLTHHLGKQGQVDVYRAKQSHVERGVIVEVLNPSVPQEEVTAFLEEVRAKVAAHIPHVCQVFEALGADGIWYMTQALPDGKNLVQLKAEDSQLSPTAICMITEAVAALYTHATHHHVAAGALYAHSIYLKGDKKINFLSPVLAGEPMLEHTPLQMKALAEVLTAHIPPPGVPGRSRIVTLIDWMANGYEGTQLDWASIAHTASTIRKQLAPTLTIKNVAGVQTKTAGAVVREIKRNRIKSHSNYKLAGIGVAACLIAAIAGYITAPSTPDKLPANDGESISFKYGDQELMVAAKPVSVKEYQEFLQAINNEKKIPRDKFLRMRSGIPGAHLKFVPLNWKEQLKNAPDSPVRGVSYWDALLYARYHDAVIPDAKLLSAARGESDSNRELCEWTATETAESATLPKSSVLLQGTPGNAPLLEPDRGARDMRYGFRIAKPTSSKN